MHWLIADQMRLVFRDRGAKAAVGASRLAIRGLDSGTQPLRDEKDRRDGRLQRRDR